LICRGGDLKNFSIFTLVFPHNLKKKRLCNRKAYKNFLVLNPKNFGKN
jgi:hypothetical protein